MTYKSAVAGINLGGGKSVIIGDNKRRRPGGAVPRARPLHGDARRPLHHGRGHRHQPGRHGVHQARDRPRRRAARPVGRSVAGDRLRRLHGHEGGGQGAVGQRQPRREDGGGAGRAARWRTTCAATCMRKGAKLIVTDIDAEKVRRVVAGVRRRGGGPRRRSTTRRPTSTRRARSAPPSTTTPCARLKVEIIARRRQQPARRGPRTATQLEQRGILYAPDYVINGGGVINVYGELHRWPAGAGQEEGGRDLRHAAPDLRDRQAGADPDLPGRGPAGRGADRGGRWRVDVDESGGRQ